MTNPLHSFPTAAELLNAVAEEWPTPGSAPSAYTRKVRARALEIIAREALRGPDDEIAHRERLDALGFADDAALARELRSGATDWSAERWAATADALLADAEARLAVMDPAALAAYESGA